MKNGPKILRHLIKEDTQMANKQRCFTLYTIREIQIKIRITEILLHTYYNNQNQEY